MVFLVGLSGLVVIADGFDAYLQMLMDGEYDFINEEDSLEGWD